MTTNITTKKQKSYKLSIFLIIMITGILISYGQSSIRAESYLIGSWKFEEVSSLQRITPDDNLLLDSNPQLRTRLLSNYVNRILDFRSDGSFTQIDGTGRIVNGTWRLEDSILTIESKKGSIWVQQISKMEDDQLVLVQKAKGDGQPVLPELYFTKIK